MISKDNERLIITLNKSDFQKLRILNTHFNKMYNLELTKSQVIKILINGFNIDFSNKEKPQEQTNKKPNIKKNLTYNAQISNQERKAQADTIRADYKTKLNELKTKLNLTQRELSELLNINFETLKEYFKGKRAPNENNKILIDEALKKYGII